MRTLTRRSLGMLSASALAWAAVRRGRGAVVSEALLSEVTGQRDLLSTPVPVPHDFIGMHAHRWPGVNGEAAPPSYSFGAARSHDHDGTAWNQIHLAADSYDWHSLDRWVAAHSPAKRTLIYTLYGTPAWLATDAMRRDLYGRPGGAAPPRDGKALEKFIRALLLRYNGDGHRRIHFLETWNEPHFEGESRDFWWGTAEELVGVGRAVYTAAKQVDADIRVLSPGFVGELSGELSLALPRVSAAAPSSAYQYLTASDGQGGRGAQWCDGLAFHTYNLPLTGPNVGYARDLVRLKKMLSLIDVRLPLYNTECGFVEPHPFRTMQPAEQALHLKRIAAVQAASGVQGLYFYSHDDDLVGNPSRHPEVAAALDQLHHTLAGNMLRQVSVRRDGTVQMVTEKETLTW